MTEGTLSMEGFERQFAEHAEVARRHGEGHRLAVAVNAVTSRLIVLVYRVLRAGRTAMIVFRCDGGDRVGRGARGALPADRAGVPDGGRGGAVRGRVRRDGGGSARGRAGSPRVADDGQARRAAEPRRCSTPTSARRWTRGRWRVDRRRPASGARGRDESTTTWTPGSRDRRRGVAPGGPGLVAARRERGFAAGAGDLGRAAERWEELREPRWPRASERGSSPCARAAGSAGRSRRPTWRARRGRA